MLLESNEVNFRATRDLDMVLLVEALTPEFGEKFWEFIIDGKYRNKVTNGSNPQFYRFDKPEDDRFPKMIELFCRSNFKRVSSPLAIKDTEKLPFFEWEFLYFTEKLLCEIDNDCLKVR